MPSLSELNNIICFFVIVWLFNCPEAYLRFGTTSKFVFLLTCITYIQFFYLFFFVFTSVYTEKSCA
ncbi:hypothetical protein CQA71_06245 [Escherichia coli]|nr:hypothetical protein CQA00_07355 [Escherichia coli]PCR60373.1 hypothetical protein CQA71_06245 [Escherichia coli]